MDDDDVESKETDEEDDYSSNSGKLGITEENENMNLTLYVLVPVATLILCIYFAFLLFNERKQDKYVRII